MDYRNEIIRMVQAVCPESALKKIYKFVRMVYNSLCGAERNRAWKTGERKPLKRS